MSKSKNKIAEVLRDTKFLTKKLQKGVNSALLMHKRAGNAVCEWRNGKVVWIPPEDIIVKPD